MSKKKKEKKTRRYKTTIELSGELTSWVIFGLGVSFALQAFIGIKDVDTLVGKASLVRDLTLTFGIGFIITSLAYTIINKVASKTEANFIFTFQKFIGHASLVTLVGFGMFQLSAQLFLDSLSFNLLWLISNLVVIAILLLVGVDQSSKDKPKSSERTTEKVSKELINSGNILEQTAERLMQTEERLVQTEERLLQTTEKLMALERKKIETEDDVLNLLKSYTQEQQIKQKKIKEEQTEEDKIYVW